MAQTRDNLIVLKLTIDPERTENPNNWNWNDLLDLGPDEYVTVLACEAIAEPE